MVPKKFSRIIVSFLVVTKSLHALVSLTPKHVRNLSSISFSERRIGTCQFQKFQCQSESNRDPTENISTENIPKIPILYESDRILIIDKPPGISHHNDGDETSGIVTFIRQQQRQRLWGVHRLDRVTSGILIFAKDATMASLLSNAFAEGKIKKIYVGISAKLKPKKKQGWVQGGMSRSRDKSWKLNRGSQKDSKKFAKTRFFTVKLSSEGDNTESANKYTCILFRPYTGRTHQLRVAAKAMGIALLGDPIYKDGQASEESTSPPTRTYLHATGIAIPSLDGEDEINLWHPPPFDSLLESDSLHAVLEKLMKNHCDVPGIVSAMESKH
jgi:tRNA pseudouridine32 synthase/23S rRNA pseudouridine746 synthase